MRHGLWLVLFAGTACSSSESGDTGFGPASFTINDQEFASSAVLDVEKASQVEWVVSFYTLDNNSCGCIIDGPIAWVSLTGPADAKIAPGAYAIASTGAQIVASVSYQFPGDANVLMTSGTVQVTESTASLLVGTFSADGTDSGSGAVHVAGAFHAGACPP